MEEVEWFYHHERWPWRKGLSTHYATIEVWGGLVHAHGGSLGAGLPRFGAQGEIRGVAGETA